MASSVLRQPKSVARDVFRKMSRKLASLLPKGLYARSLIIIITPVVLLQSVIAYVFMERHWQLVTQRLSAAVTADIAALIDIHESFPREQTTRALQIAAQRLALQLDILEGETLPPPGPKPFFTVLDEALSDEIRRQIKRPFWIDTVGRSNLIEIRVPVKDGVLRAVARRSLA